MTRFFVLFAMVFSLATMLSAQAQNTSEVYMSTDRPRALAVIGHRYHLLMRNISDANKSAPAGWWREIGKGRFVYLAPGHTPEALGHPMMQRLIRNSVRWLMRQTDDK